MTWKVIFQEEFEPEFDRYPEVVQDEALASAKLLERFGPQLGRPWADTLNGSKHSNMKELRFGAAGGIWRLAFAFDPKRQAVLLAAGDKSGTNEKHFYRQLIRKADKRFEAHVAALAKRRR